MVAREGSDRYGSRSSSLTQRSARVFSLHPPESSVQLFASLNTE